MPEPDDNVVPDAPARPPRGGPGRACVSCGRVDSPIRIGPGPGWLALFLWGAAAALWTLGLVLGATWLMWPTAAVFLAALLYTLWYFARREEACRHCGTRWDHVREGGPAA